MLLIYKHGSGVLRTWVLLNSHVSPRILQPSTRVDAWILATPASGWATLGVCSHSKRHLQLILLGQCKLHLLSKCYWAGNCGCLAWLVSWVRSQLPRAQCSSGWVLELALNSCSDTSQWLIQSQHKISYPAAWLQQTDLQWEQANH